MSSKITKQGNAVSVDYGAAADRYLHYTINILSGLYVGIKAANPALIETNALGTKPKEFPPQAIDTIDNVTISGATDEEKALDIYNKLKALLE